MDTSTIERLITSGIPEAQVEVVDLNGTGDHFELTVVSDRFDGRPLVERHRMVYAALGEAMDGPIHAVMIRALTPAQYREGLVQDIDRS